MRMAEDVYKFSLIYVNYENFFKLRKWTLSLNYAIIKQKQAFVISVAASDILISIPLYWEHTVHLQTVTKDRMQKVYSYVAYSCATCSSYQFPEFILGVKQSFWIVCEHFSIAVYPVCQLVCLLCSLSLELFSEWHLVAYCICPQSLFKEKQIELCGLLPHSRYSIPGCKNKRFSFCSYCYYFKITCCRHCFAVFSCYKLSGMQVR